MEEKRTARKKKRDNYVEQQRLHKTDKQKYHLCSSRDMTQKIVGRSRMDSADTAAVA